MVAFPTHTSISAMVSDSSNVTIAQTSIAITSLMYGLVALAKCYPERITLVVLEHLVAATSYILMTVWVVMRSTQTNLKLARTVAFSMVLLHPFLHYIGEKGTVCDFTWHIVACLSGVHTTLLRKHSKLFGGCYILAFVLAGLHQLSTYLSSTPDSWGIFMMKTPLLTGLLTLDGIVAPACMVVDFCWANVEEEQAHEGDTSFPQYRSMVLNEVASNQQLDSFIWSMWMLGGGTTIVYVGIMDGPTFGQMAMYGTVLEFITTSLAIQFCLKGFLVFEIKFVSANSGGTRDPLTALARKQL